jgi:hypothetical protein
MKLAIERIAGLPALAWAAEIRERGRALHVVCGDAVEADENGIVAGAWAGDFAARGIAHAATSTGTALRLASPAGAGRQSEPSLVAVVGTASTSPLHRWRGAGRARGRVVLSNSLALALAAAGDRLAPFYPFYPQVLYSIVLGPERYRAELPVAGGRLAVFYRSMAIDAAGRARPLPAPDAPGFADFAGYRALLRAEIASLFANAADPARRFRYAPIASLSAGYDSPASAALAAEAGCRAAYTFRQSVGGAGAPEMRPWTLGGDYDRPIARRILEEAGVARSAFAERKRLVTPAYDSITRRAPPLERFLSQASLAAFERWFDDARPIGRGRALRHRLLVETLGKIVWSGKVRRWFLRRGLHYPPLAGRLWHWRVPVRKNAFVFNWAVERQVAMYRRALGSRLPPPP